jgi:hypothetical protein
MKLRVKNMRKCLVLAVLICLLGLACGQQTPPPTPTPPPPPEKTAEQLYAEIKPALAPAEAVLAETPLPGGFTPEVKALLMEGLQKARTANQGSENGKQALSMLTRDIESLISKARDLKRWKAVMGLIEVYETMAPGTTKMNRLKERAQLYIDRPNVVLKGFVDDKQSQDTYAFIEVTDKKTGETKQMQVKPGEEFFGVRLQDIVGNQAGIQLEYLAIPGETWEVTMSR